MKHRVLSSLGSPGWSQVPGGPTVPCARPVSPSDPAIPGTSLICESVLSHCVHLPLPVDHLQCVTSFNFLPELSLLPVLASD